MILITGGTGFIGRHLVPYLSDLGYQVRLLIKPSKDSPLLPSGMTVDAAVCSLNDERGLMAAMKGVDTIIHLAGSERMGARADLTGGDIQGTKTLITVAIAAKVKRILYMSRIGADVYSAFPVLKAKAFSENTIIQSGIPYTIFRSGPIFGKGDQFIHSFYNAMQSLPGIMLLPNNGEMNLHPLWIEDLMAVVGLSLSVPETENKMFCLGGPEFLPLEEILSLIMQHNGKRRLLIKIPPTTMRMLALYAETYMKKPPISIYWLDTLATDRTCPLDTLPKKFGIIPARLSEKIASILEN
ncbi:MAG: NAD(P)H-binding protein [Anaerolineaceae bacterium]|nr:NAD(P)H-binding protein [Anaerolineaceae bacterium]